MESLKEIFVNAELKTDLTIFGATGFIGGKYHSLYPGNTRIVYRGQEDENPPYDDALYFISTTNNYHVFDNPRLDIKTNLDKLMEVLPEVEGTFNFISSWFVYGNRGIYEVKEDAVCFPKGFYSITKRTAELLIESYCATFKKKYRILRLSNIIGKDPKASSKKNALEFMIGKLRRNEPVEIYEGDNYRNYLDIEDCCAAIKLVIEAGNFNEIYNIGSNESTRFYDIIQHAAYRLKSKSEIKIVPVPEFHKIVQTPDFWMDTIKLRALGFKQKYDIWETIDRIVA